MICRLPWRGWYGAPPLEDTTSPQYSRPSQCLHSRGEWGHCWLRLARKVGKNHEGKANSLPISRWPFPQILPLLLLSFSSSQQKRFTLCWYTQLACFNHSTLNNNQPTTNNNQQSTINNNNRQRCVAEFFDSWSLNSKAVAGLDNLNNRNHLNNWKNLDHLKNNMFDLRPP